MSYLAVFFIAFEYGPQPGQAYSYEHWHLPYNRLQFILSLSYRQLIEF